MISKYTFGWANFEAAQKFLLICHQWYLWQHPAIWIFQWQSASILVFVCLFESVSLHLTALNSVRDWFINDFIFRFSGENTRIRNWFIRRRVESNPFQREERLCVIRWFISSRNVGIYVGETSRRYDHSRRFPPATLLYRHAFGIDKDRFM